MKEVIRRSRCMEIISSYERKEPLSSHLRKYFQQHREMGSADRRIVRELVYNYYRLGSGLKNESLELRLAVSNFIFNNAADETTKFLLAAYPGLNADAAMHAAQKFEIASRSYPSLSKNNLFPFTGHLTRFISPDAWLESFFEKPLVWLRAKRSEIDLVKRSLESANISFIQPPGMPATFGVEPGSAITGTDAFKNGMLEIQDLSSQRTGAYFTMNKKNESWWDCCAGSGGKSLMLIDNNHEVTLTVSDVRPSILENLKKRFARSGQKHVSYFTADLLEGPVNDKKFDAIILDAPCTGSGTWNRTPEMLNNFREEEIADYANRQKIMLRHVVPSLNSGGRIIYITCSVFREENEEITAHAETLGLRLTSQSLLDGTSERADSLFVGVLVLPH